MAAMAATVMEVTVVAKACPNILGYPPLVDVR
jgi:hypothetical protein